MGFFKKIKEGLKKTRDAVVGQIDSMLKSFTKIDDELFEELEELQSVDSTLPGMSGALPVLQEHIDPEKAESELLRDKIMSAISSDEEKSASALGMWLVRKDT